MRKQLAAETTMNRFKLPSIILCYHRIGVEELGGPSRLSTSPENFRAHIKWLRSLGYNFVSLENFSEKGPGLCSVTFDDGYKDLITEALPLLVELRVPATIFISSYFIQNEAPFPADLFCPQHGDRAENIESWHFDPLHRLTSLPLHDFFREHARLAANFGHLCHDGEPMSKEDIEIAAKESLLTFGPHTHTHRSIPNVPHEELATELAAPVNYLQDLNVPMLNFYAIPFGQGVHVSEAVAMKIRELGFEPLTTIPLTPSAAKRSAMSRFGQPRISIGPWPLREFQLKLSSVIIGSIWPAMWLRLLAIRRRIMESRI